MQSGTGRAPGKVILAGEHFVVHGAPALALPLEGVGKEVRVELSGAGVPGRPPRLEIQDGHRSQRRLSMMALRALEVLAISTEIARIEVRSTLAPGAHLGSSASLAVALVRALGDAARLELDDADVAEAAYELERIVHGTPSGIDNTVVALRRPVRFVRGTEPRPFPIALRATLLVADTGVASSTAEIVAAVGRFAEADPAGFGEIVARARAVVEELLEALAAGDAGRSGRAMDENQVLLDAIGAGAPRLEELITTARKAGALGAKLTGAGGGGCMLALAEPDGVAAVRAALEGADARFVLEVPLEEIP